MRKKHTDQQVYSSSEVPQSHNAKRTEKNTRKKNKAVLNKKSPVVIATKQHNIRTKQTDLMLKSN